MSRRLPLRYHDKPIEASYEQRGTQVVIERGGRAIQAEVRREGERVQVASGSATATCVVASAPRGIWVAHDGASYFLEYDRAESAVPTEGADELRAPMTGRVAAVATREGAEVREGDLLVTIEAMKMEFRIVAPEDATVEAVRCAEGQQVELGDLLVVLRESAR